VARRTATRLDTSPTTMAMTGSVAKALPGMTTGWAKKPPMKLATIIASTAASRVTTTACTARLSKSSTEEDPSALSTAKSRTRCSADT
jgi:hypothetical protein